MAQDNPAEPWNDYAPSAPPPAGTPEAGPWNDYAAPKQSFLGSVANTAAAGAPILGAAGALMLNVEDRTTAALHAFGETMDEEGRKEQFGFSEDSMQWMRRAGYFPSDQSSVLTKPVQATAEMLMVPAVKALDAAWRAPGAFYTAAEEAGVAAGLPRDVAALPQAFAGSPGGLHVGEPPPTVKPAPIRPIEGSSAPALPRSQLAATGVPEVDAVLKHPVLTGVIDNPTIDRSHEVPNSWGGSVPLENPVTYVDKDFPKTLTVDGVTFDPAEPAAIHENVEEFVITQLMKGGMDRDAALRAAYWGWGNPAEHAWYRQHGMDPEHVEAELKPYLDKIAARKPDPKALPPDLFKETYPDGDPLKDTAGEVGKPSAEEAAQAKKIIADITGPRITGGTADKPDLYVAKDMGIIGPERPSINDGTPEEAARATIQPITAFHGSPYSFDAFDTGKINTGERSQTFGHGLYFAETREVAEKYQRDVFPEEKQKRLRELEKQYESLPEGEARNAVGKEVGNLLTSGNFYQVRIHANREHMLDWDKPLSEQSDAVKAAIERLPKDLHDFDWKPGYMHLKIDADLSPVFREAGIPGIKYLDQGSRFQPEQVEHLQKQIAELEKLQKEGRTDVGDALAKRREELAQMQPTSNFVIFDHNDVEITHRNGEPVKPPAPPIRPPEKPPEAPATDSWQARFDHFVSRIDKPEDVRQMIHEAATENDNFPEARRGPIPAMQTKDLADALGVSPEEITNSKIIRQVLPTDVHTRFVMQAALNLIDRVKEGARDVLANPTDENFIKFQEHIMRRDMMVEQVLGMRAQWGRVGNVFQEFMGKVKDGVELDKFLSTQCPL